MWGAGGTGNPGAHKKLQNHPALATAGRGALRAPAGVHLAKHRARRLGDCIMLRTPHQTASPQEGRYCASSSRSLHRSCIFPTAPSSPPLPARPGDRGVLQVEADLEVGEGGGGQEQQAPVTVCCTLRPKEVPWIGSSVPGAPRSFSRSRW